MEIKRENTFENILVICMGFLILHIIFNVKALFFASFTIGMGGLLSSTFRNIVNALWYKIIYLISYINSRLLIALIFYLLLFPMSLLSRLFSKDPLQLKKGKDASYYIERNHLYLKNDLDELR